MKRYIAADSRADIIQHVINGLSAQGCTNIKVVPHQSYNTYTQFSLILPSGKATKLTVWYSSIMHTADKDEYQTTAGEYSKLLNIDDNGNILDESGKIIGYVEVRLYTNKHKRSRTRDFKKDSITTNLGDINIRNLQTSQDFKAAVTALEDRTVTT